jgi:hypothetical protein
MNGLCGYNVSASSATPKSIRSTEKYLVTYTADTRCTAGRQGSLSDLGGRD